MRKMRVFKLKVVKLCKWAFKPKRKPTACGDYLRLNSPDRIKPKTMTKICSWGRFLTERFRLSLGKRGYARVGQAPSVAVPKGHLAVYVGQKDDDDPHRYVVPVIYFNHPLFSELLREAEKEYGFQHPGGITIPCPASQFEKVQTRIAAGVNCRKLTFWRPS